MQPLQQIRRLWLNRLLWLIVLTPALVFAIHMPAGIRYEKMEPFTLPDGRVITNAVKRVWHLEPTMAALRQFPTDLVSGKIHYREGSHDPGFPFLPVLRQGWFRSFELFAVSVGAGSVLGLLVGVLVSLRGRLLKSFSLTVSVLTLSLPDFFVVMSLQFLSTWFWLRYDVKPFLVISDPYTIKGWVVPLIGMMLFPVGYMARLTASAMDDVMREEYIRTARGKGLSEAAVILGHGLRNAIPRILAGLPTLLTVTLSSLPVVERFTVWPGISKWFSVRTPPDNGQLFGVTPAIACLAVGLMILWFVLFDGLANSIRIITSPRQPEVMRP